ncbi:hypothetical protein PHAVU_001G052400 [Phaseolus vulgaris]|uniref:Transcription factor n=1 Tax=Phaseolus vulgaris TaxID=3885 RepID=V7CV25_PHAVU|nr:hypothetical protein PHAVU_001G052400g [Phaseolus vulgaris]ESW33218.1 hypothetical protein PHAVU_001G052400g [Phaseolus vulgaris]
MAASRPQTPQSTASSIIPLLHQSQFLHDQAFLQRRLQMIFEGARERWMYAIYWVYSPADSLLCWGDGYYNGNGKPQKTTWPTEQAQRKSVLKLLNSLISGPSATHDDCDEDVTDPEWLFLLSTTYTFVNGSGLSESACQRAWQLQQFGLQTMVCIPCPNGVVELASSEVLLPNPVLVIKVLALINLNGPVADLTSAEIIRPREDKRLYERGSMEMQQNHENGNLSKQSRGKEKESDSKCSWSLLSGTSDGGSESTYSHSNDYSGPSRIYHVLFSLMKAFNFINEEAQNYLNIVGNMKTRNSVN